MNVAADKSDFLCGSLASFSVFMFVTRLRGINYYNGQVSIVKSGPLAKISEGDGVAMTFFRRWAKLDGQELQGELG